MTIVQIVAIAGDGRLRDATDSSEEFRQFLNVAPSENLFIYARHCLENPFDKSGLVLQDIVNELGRRLDFDVSNGLYQGRRNAVGFDGIWRFKDETDLVVEVKTTDYVTVSLDKLANYRNRLAAENRVQTNASMLVVVGREDTGALEAQVRGSRHAWEMRLISVEGLIKLVQIKEKSDEPGTHQQIRQLLQPFEYTKIDRIIDVIFKTASDVESQSSEEGVISDAEDGEDLDSLVRTAPALVKAKRQEAITAFAALKHQELVQRSSTFFWSPDKEFRVCCAVSKRYERDYQPYWYAYHPKWDQFLAEGKDAYMILVCMDRDSAFALPYSWLAANKQNLNETRRGETRYWHITLVLLDNQELAINLPRIGQKVSLLQYHFDFKGAKGG